MHYQKAPRNRSASDWAAQASTAAQVGDLQSARKYLVSAIRADGKTASYRFNLALILEAMGDRDEAAEQLTKVLRIDPRMTAASRRLCWILSRGTLGDETLLDHDGLKAALSHDTADRDLLTAVALHQLSYTSSLRGVLDRSAARGWAQSARDLCLKKTGDLLKTPLFLEALQRGVVSRPEIERLLTDVRRVLLLEMPRERLADTALARFCTALMRQCWLNEFVWGETPEETQALKARPIATEQVLLGESSACREFLLHAMYRNPGALLRDAPGERDLSAIKPDLLRDALAARLAEERDIQVRGKDIARLGAISDEVSQKVAAQYEDSPYPRWTSVLVYREGHYLEKLGGVFTPSELAFTKRPFDVLIAGCGTGRQAVSAAFDYGRNARVTGLDLTAASLGYASMMADRMGADNLTFVRGDIQNLERDAPAYSGRFNVIECTGVLHHMARPFDGWRTLIRCLAPGGLMLVGLYSRIARRNLVSLKSDPSFPGPDCSDAALREYRHHLQQLPDDAPGTEFRKSLDFYSASGFRDYFLHVNEQSYTLPEIAAFLSENKLVFRGFFDLPFDVLKRRFPGEAWPGSLDRWADVEMEQRELFAGMYQFWVTAAA